MAGIKQVIARVKAWLSGSSDSPKADYLPPGLYHYQRQRAGERSRIHLRIDPDQHGLLLVNASRVLHLNPTAAYMAYMALEDLPSESAVNRLTQAYRVSESRAHNDYTQFVDELS